MLSAAKKNGSGFPPTTTIQRARTSKKANSSAAARPSEAEKRGSGVTPDYDTTQHAHAQKKAKCSGHAKRSEEEWLGVSPAAAIQLARSSKKANSSTAARPSAAEKGGSGETPDYDTTQHAHAQKKAKCSGQAERSGERWFECLPRLRQSNSQARRRRPS
jgi:hypothetical protein